MGLWRLEMDKKKVNTLLFISGVGLIIAGIIFLLIALFDQEKNNWLLASALFCTLLSNLFNIIRVQLNKKK